MDWVVIRVLAGVGVYVWAGFYSQNGASNMVSIVLRSVGLVHCHTKVCLTGFFLMHIFLPPHLFTFMLNISSVRSHTEVSFCNNKSWLHLSGGLRHEFLRLLKVVSRKLYL